MGTHTFYTKDGKQHVFVGDILKLDKEIANKEILIKTPKQEYAALLLDAEKIDFIAEKLGLK